MRKPRELIDYSTMLDSSALEKWDAAASDARHRIFGRAVATVAAARSAAALGAAAASARAPANSLAGKIVRHLLSLFLPAQQPRACGDGSALQRFIARHTLACCIVTVCLALPSHQK